MKTNTLATHARVALLAFPLAFALACGGTMGKITAKDPPSAQAVAASSGQGAQARATQGTPPTRVPLGTVVTGAQIAPEQRTILRERAREEARRAVQGTELNDVVSLLTNAEKPVQEAQQYETYLGAWQLMRLYYNQDQTPQKKVALDAIESICKTYPQYRSDQFVVEKSRG